MYPVTYEADYLRERNRLTTFFRLILAIPWFIVAIIYSIAVFFTVIAAWFALLVTGRYPDGLYNFNSGALRFFMRVSGWFSLQTDAWPPFGFGADPAYPIRVQVAPKAESQDRLKTLGRIILAIPLFVVSFGISYVQQGAAFIAWVTIVFRGYQPVAVHKALAYALSWSTRAGAYLLLLRDEYPPVGDEGEHVGEVRGGPPAGTTGSAEAPPPAAPGCEASERGSRRRGLCPRP
jgi:Domain of unknown function (DUF4389)